MPTKLFKKGQIPWNKGKGILPHVREKLLQSRIGKSPWNKGKKLSEEHIEKLRQAKLGKRGPETNNWQGGRAKKFKEIFFSKQYAEWRKTILERDNFICQMCGYGEYVTAHHIKPWRQNIDLVFDLDNGITLCAECHMKVDKYRSPKKYRRTP